MPCREPTDDAVLARTGIGECFAVALDAYDFIAKPAVVIGHSMGGLLAQKIAAARSPLAAALLASVPPGVLWPRRRALPHLFPILPRILAGQPFLPSTRTMREVPLNTLPRAEQEELMPRLVRDSGRVFREMCMGGASPGGTAPSGRIIRASRTGSSPNRHSTRWRRPSWTACGGTYYSARRYRRLIMRWASEVTGPANRLHHVPCRENALTSAWTAPPTGS
jgi:pimeloyl-ACP methyl ester carboxylesterase